MLITKLQYNKFEHSATFKDFFDLAWNEIVRLLGQCGNPNRLDIVGDNHEEDHLLKGATRSSRGTGTTVEVHPNAVLPNNFGSDFMKSSKNKASLYSAMADYFLEKSEGWLKERRVLVFTKDRNTITLPAEYDSMNDSSHIEADYRLILHILHGAHRGIERSIIRCNDTDILILLISFMSEFSNINPNLDIIADFGSGKDRKFIDIRTVYNKLGGHKTRGLLFLHSFSGCDYTNGFYGIGKVTFWDVYMEANIPNIYECFKNLSKKPHMITDDDMSIIMQFVRRAYKCHGSSDMNAARFDVITHNRVKTFREVPPSTSAILIHSQRAAYISGHLWGQALTECPTLPPFCDWGWSVDQNFLLPKWTNKTDSKAYDRLMRTCRCTKGCLTASCKCTDTACLSYCQCRGECAKDNEDSELDENSDENG